jgi:hypothetical protein
MAEYGRWIEEFVGLFLDSPYRRKVTFGLNEEWAAASREYPLLEYPLAPADMLAGKIDVEGMAPWHPVPSPIDDDMVDGFERFLGKPLPGIFRAYLTYQALLDVNLYLGSLPDIDPRYPLSWLEWCVLRRRKPLYEARSWLIPFTQGPVHAGALCFDTRRPDGRGDYPIIRVPCRYEEDLPSNDLLEVDYKVFASCEAYFDFLREWLLYQVSGTRWEDVPFSAWLEQRGKTMPPETVYDE